MSNLADAWNNPTRQWPTIVYVETSSLCNYRCPCCRNWAMNRPKCVMDLPTFITVALKIRERGVKIGAMYCNAEPLTDPTIFQKYAFANRLDILMPYVGFNTNASLLSPDKYKPLVENCPNVTISVFAVGDDYVKATGGFSWENAYRNIIGLIEYRDVHRSDFDIRIGCNQIPGQQFDSVKEAFKNYRVEVVTDVFIDWNNPEKLTGPLSRLKMFPEWMCDGLKGALQIRPDGSCGYCAYDFHGAPDGTLETGIGNILRDSWDVLESNFKAKWKQPSTVCFRCDYWHGSRDIIRNYPK
jgi:MoaA/NifB/PqqE/SkfB family radical SAM enzyme